MATINGYTAERMKEIHDKAIVDGDVVGDDLILTARDGTTINAGNVRGFPGISDMELYDPIGVPKPFLLSALPSGYGICDAQTEYDAASYPILSGEFLTGTACVNGACAPGNFRLPDMRGETFVGLHTGIAAFDTLLKRGGSKDAVVISHEHGATADQAAHDHGFDIHAANHDHDHTTGSGGTHSHTVDGGDGGDRIAITYATGWGLTDTGVVQSIAYSSVDATSGGHSHGNTGAASSASHDHGFTFNATDPAISVDVHLEGVPGTDKNLPPYRVGNWIMRLG